MVDSWTTRSTSQQTLSDGVGESGVLYSETLRASLQEGHDYARAARHHSHARQKHYYDLRCCQASYAVGDLVRVKTRPRSDAQSNFAAELAPLFTGRSVLETGRRQLQTV